VAPRGGHAAKGLQELPLSTGRKKRKSLKEGEAWKERGENREIKRKRAVEKKNQAPNEPEAKRDPEKRPAGGEGKYGVPGKLEG